MVKEAKNLGYDLQMECWERMWLKGLKLSFNLKDFF